MHAPNISRKLQLIVAFAATHALLYSLDRSLQTHHHGLGAVLLQRSDNQWKAVAYASRALSETEIRYAQIEKEALAVTWACERFSKYLPGRTFSVETDHKLLVPLLSNKHLDSLPTRILRYHLQLGWYSYTISHVPGKLLYTVDALSWASNKSTNEHSRELEEEVEAHVAAVVASLHATPERLSQYRDAQQ